MKRCTQILVCALALFVAAPAAWADIEDGGWDDSGWGGDFGWGDGGDWTTPGWDGATSILDDQVDPVVQFEFMEAPDDGNFDCRDGGYSCLPYIEPVAWFDWLTPPRLDDLNAVDRGTLQPDSSTRLGAYEASRGYTQGTVGYAVHNAIGDIYLLLGADAQEQIGLVLGSEYARSLYDQPVTSAANLAIATFEHDYWVAVKQANPWSVGGQAGAAFTPEVRAWLQENVYSRDLPALRDVPQLPRP